MSRPSPGPGPAPASYHSEVVAPLQIVVGVLSGVLLAALLVALRSSLWPFAVVAFVAACALAVYLATVSLTVEPGHLMIGQGRGEREPRILYASELASSSAQRLTWRQCFGVGVEPGEPNTRLTVRAGPTLCLTLPDGEVIRISTRDPETALRVLDTPPKHRGAAPPSQ